MFKFAKKSSVPTKSTPKSSAPAGKPFVCSHTFDFEYHMLMNFAATLYDSHEITVSISAYARDYEGHHAGDIELQLSAYNSSLAARKKLLYESDSSSNKGLYQLFYGSACHSDEVIRYSYNEPDCYIFGCPEVYFRQEVEEYCPHAYVDFYRHYQNGYFCATIKFKPISWDQVDENWQEYKRYNKIVFGL